MNEQFTRKSEHWNSRQTSYDVGDDETGIEAAIFQGIPLTKMLKNMRQPSILKKKKEGAEQVTL